MASAGRRADLGRIARRGHSSIAITDKRYGRISAVASAASAQAVADRLPRLRGRVLDMEQARHRRLVRLG
ncbi:hypothetical protein ACWESM_18280 [Nocardia sp. NPDC003999]